MLGYYNFSAVLTYVGLAISVFGMRFALTGHLSAALICLMLSGVCDMFDGKIARRMDRTRQEEKFGIQIDSLCDLICFGVLPICIGYSVGVNGAFGMFCSILFLLAAVIRLGYFNVMEEERQSSTTEIRRSYRGLPVTTAALIVPMVCFAKLLAGDLFHVVYELSLLVIAVLFLADFKVVKPHQKWLAAMVLLGLCIFALLVQFGKLL